MDDLSLFSLQELVDEIRKRVDASVIAIYKERTEKTSQHALYTSGADITALGLSKMAQQIIEQRVVSGLEDGPLPED